MSAKSILTEIGHGLEVFFGDAVKVAVLAEPIVDIALPGIATLYNASLSEIVAAENAAIAAGKQNGTGAQKLALVLASPAFQTAVTAFEQTAGITLSPTAQTIWINAIVAMLNAIPPSGSAASGSGTNTTGVTDAGR
jgi:hypothetical protein